MLAVLAVLAVPAHAAPVTESQDHRQIYAAESFAPYRPVTATDMVRRIPGIEFLLGDSVDDEENERGLTGPAERLLIDGRSVTAKQQDTRRLLDRIAAARVERIEVLFASTAQVTASPARPAVNIVLHKSEAEGRGTWEASLHQQRRGRPRPGGKVVWSGALGSLQYGVDVEIEPEYAVEDLFEQQMEQNVGVVESRPGRATEEGYSFGIGGNGEWALGSATLGINGLLSEQDVRERERTWAARHSPAAPAGPEEVEEQLDREDEREWELAVTAEAGGDGAAEWDVAALHREVRERSRSREWEGDHASALEATSRERESRVEAESILRGAWRRPAGDGGWISAGLEIAHNTFDTSLDVWSEEDGALVPRSIFNADHTIRELRLEPFVIRQWAVSPRLDVLGALTAEQSWLAQRGSDVRQSRRDSYLRPRLELRYRLSSVTHIDLGVERTVSQLDFEDFAASFDQQDDEVEAGNPDLEPQWAWELSAGLERSLLDDEGRLGLRLFLHDVHEVIDRVPGPDGAQPGNAGRGRRVGFTVEAALALDAAGMPGAVLEAAWHHTESRVRDPFTGEHRIFRELPENIAVADFRQDVAEWGAAYGIALEYEGPRYEFDDEDAEREADGPDVEVFFEKRLGDRLRVRVEVDNLLDVRERSRRMRFERRGSGGGPAEIETEWGRTGRALTVRLEGQF
jgi:hypothetical protein